MLVCPSIFLLLIGAGSRREVLSLDEQKSLLQIVMTHFPHVTVRSPLQFLTIVKRSEIDGKLVPALWRHAITISTGCK